MKLLPRVALVSLAVLLASGCTTPQPAPESPGATTADVQPEAFSSRAPLESCGVIELGQGERIPQDAIECMSSSSSAELAVTTPTTEGDPIPRYYRTTEAGLEVWTDGTHDTWGAGGWTHEICPDARSIIETGDCTTG